MTSLPYLRSFQNINIWPGLQYSVECVCVCVCVCMCGEGGGVYTTWNQRLLMDREPIPG